jgi:hypothetical protein
MRLATHDIRFENTIEHRDVIDALLRQPHSDAAVPFVAHRVGEEGGVIRAADYDLGRSGVAWSDVYEADTDGPGERVPWWNTGRTWRNDGVDIAVVEGEPVVVEFETGEWLRYTLTAETAGNRVLTVVGAGGRVSVTLNGGAAVSVDLPTGEKWGEAVTGALPFMEGVNTLVLKAEDCPACRVMEMRVAHPRFREDERYLITDQSSSRPVRNSTPTAVRAPRAKAVRIEPVATAVETVTGRVSYHSTMSASCRSSSARPSAS